MNGGPFAGTFKRLSGLSMGSEERIRGFEQVFSDIVAAHDSLKAVKEPAPSGAAKLQFAEYDDGSSFVDIAGIKLEVKRHSPGDSRDL